MAAEPVSVRSPVRSAPKKEWAAGAVGTDDYLASLTRRLDLLEKKLVGRRGMREGYPPLYPAVKVSQLSVLVKSFSIHFVLVFDSTVLPGEAGG